MYNLCICPRYNFSLMVSVSFIQVQTERRVIPMICRTELPCRSSGPERRHKPDLAVLALLRVVGDGGFSCLLRAADLSSVTLFLSYVYEASCQ